MRQSTRSNMFGKYSVTIREKSGNMPHMRISWKTQTLYETTTRLGAHFSRVVLWWRTGRSEINQPILLVCVISACKRGNFLMMLGWCIFFFPWVMSARQLFIWRDISVSRTLGSDINICFQKHLDMLLFLSIFNALIWRYQNGQIMRVIFVVNVAL